MLAAQIVGMLNIRPDFGGVCIFDQAYQIVHFLSKEFIGGDQRPPLHGTSNGDRMDLIRFFFERLKVGDYLAPIEQRPIGAHPVTEEGFRVRRCGDGMRDGE